MFTSDCQRTTGQNIDACRVQIPDAFSTNDKNESLGSDPANDKLRNRNEPSPTRELDAGTIYRTSLLDVKEFH